MLSKNAVTLLENRYCHPGEKADDVFKRIAKYLASNSEEETAFYNIMERLDFLPNSPCIRNAGHGNMLSACFVLPIEDTMDSIFESLHNAGIIFKHGGGVGYNFSNIREKGAVLSGGGTASGVISFLKIFDTITDAVKQGGFRRGAGMAILNANHPEIVSFITEKLRNKTLTNFNLSVRVNDGVMKAIEEDGYIQFRNPKTQKFESGIKASTLFQLICTSAWLNGDPGILFHDRINEDNNTDKPIVASNPCGEQHLHPYEACCLGSINLSNFVNKDGSLRKKALSDTIITSTKFLLAINKKNVFPIDKCRESVAKYNRIGLGVMGFADMLIKMGIAYDSKECLKVVDEIGKLLQITHSIAPDSASTLSIAPTGSLSLIADCSASIEPIFCRTVERKLTVGNMTETRDIYFSKWVRTAHEVAPEWHLKVQAQWQKWIDNGVSKTVNLPHDADLDFVKKIYMQAWKSGCKGVTVFRDGCLDNQVLYSAKTKCEGDSCHL